MSLQTYVSFLSSLMIQGVTFTYSVKDCDNTTNCIVNILDSNSNKYDCLFKLVG